MGHGRLELVPGRDFEHVGAGAHIARVGWVRGQVGVDVFEPQIEGFVRVRGSLSREGERGAVIEGSGPHVWAGQEEVIATRNRDLDHGGRDLHRLVSGTLVQNG